MAPCIARYVDDLIVTGCTWQYVKGFMFNSKQPEFIQMVSNMVELRTRLVMDAMVIIEL